jgi:DNA-binding protein H-NS
MINITAEDKKMNLESMTMEQLVALKKDIDVAMEKAIKREREEALQAARSAAKEHGFSLEELIGGASSEKKAKKKVAAKYANPADKTQVWTGRGRTPLWVRAAFEEGKTLSDLAI